MSLTVNSNIAALSALRHLRTNTFSLSTTLRRLSSGLRINVAADGPADLVISEGLRAQIGGVRAAIRNTQEAANLVGIAEGALTEVSGLLVKMRSLAIHSANRGVVSYQQVAADQREINRAVASIQRIVDVTRFAGDSIFTGSTRNFHIGEGATSADQVSFLMTSLNTTSGGTLSMLNEIVGSVALVSGIYEVSGDPDGELSGWFFNGENVGVNTDNEGNVYVAMNRLGAGKLNDDRNQLTNWNVTGVGELGINTDFNGQIHTTIAFRGSEAGDAFGQISGYRRITAPDFAAVTDAGNRMYFKMVDVGGGLFRVDIYRDAGFGTLIGHTADFGAGGGGPQAIIADGGSGLGGAIIVNEPGGGWQADDMSAQFNWRLELYRNGSRSPPTLIAHTADYTTATGTMALIADNGSGIGGSIDVVAVRGGDRNIVRTYNYDRVLVWRDTARTALVALGGVIGGGATTLRANGGSGLNGAVTVNYIDGEPNMRVKLGSPLNMAPGVVISRVDAAISIVAALRGRLGAFEKNTLRTNVNSLSVSLENLAATESFIRDADMAAEQSAFTRNQILVRAGVSVLAQAASVQRDLLRLLS